MKRSQTRKKVARGVSDQRSSQSLELETAEPDSLRDSVREALSQLSEVEQRAVHNDLLSALKAAGVNLGHHLLLLGIPARTADEITPAEMGILIRYVRISEPRAMAALAPILMAVLARHDEPAQRVKPSTRAA
jgi:hypothetical protein